MSFSRFSNSILSNLEKWTSDVKISLGFAEKICSFRFDREIPVGIRWAVQHELITPRYEITNSFVLSNNKLITEFWGNWFRNEENLLTCWFSPE